MAAQSKLTLLDLPPEIFPLIAGHLPLYISPRTLLALSLASKQTHEIILPILYSHLILQKESTALSVINELLANPEKGQLVRGFHIRSKLSKDVREDPNQVDVVTGLQRLIETGRLPLMHTLELHMEGHGWFLDENRELVEGYGNLRLQFWKALKEKCPELHTLTLTNVGDDPEDDPWLNESGLFDIERIRNLTLRFIQRSLDEKGNALLLSMITRLAPSLRTLNLAQNSESDEWMELTPLLSLTFPHLESITLRGQTLNETSTAMDFWNRHPKLEFIGLSYGDLDTPRFDVDGVVERVGEGKFLPKLRHLSAPFADVRALGPLLPQLVSLVVANTLNAQVPYILRSIVPDGLPNLQSLNVEQDGDPGGNFKDVEGATWWETLDGEFKTEVWKKGKKKFTKNVIDDPEWMNSVVKACPNLKELAIQSYDIKVSNYTTIVPFLSRLANLERFYYRDDKTSLEDFDDEEGSKELFIAQAKVAFEACPALVEVGDVYADPPSGYVTTRASRNEHGAVTGVEVMMGSGMVVGQEDLAFPRSNDRAGI